jgi:hypothetical protein
MEQSHNTNSLNKRQGRFESPLTARDNKRDAGYPFSIKPNQMISPDLQSLQGQPITTRDQIAKK